MSRPERARENLALPLPLQGGWFYYDALTQGGGSVSIDTVALPWAKIPCPYRADVVSHSDDCGPYRACITPPFSGSRRPPGGGVGESRLAHRYVFRLPLCFPWVQVRRTARSRPEVGCLPIVCLPIVKLAIAPTEGSFPLVIFRLRGKIPPNRRRNIVGGV